MKFSLSEKKTTLPHYIMGRSNLQWNSQFGEFQQNQQCFCQNATLHQEDPFNDCSIFFSCINESSITYRFIYAFLLQGTNDSSYQFLFGPLNVSCVLGAVNRPAELTADKLPVLKHCWEFGNNLLHPFWCFPLDLTTADFPHFFPERYPAERMGLYLAGSDIQINVHFSFLWRSNRISKYSQKPRWDTFLLEVRYAQSQPILETRFLYLYSCLCFWNSMHTEKNSISHRWISGNQAVAIDFMITTCYFV